MASQFIEKIIGFLRNLNSDYCAHNSQRVSILSQINPIYAAIPFSLFL